MKVMSVLEFARFCEAQEPCCYLFSSENQAHSGGGISVSLRFDHMKASVCPDRLIFFRGKNRLTLTGVREIRLHEPQPCVGTVFEVSCRTGREDRIFTWILDEKIFL